MPAQDPLIRPHREPDFSTSWVAPRAIGQLDPDLSLSALCIDKPALSLTVRLARMIAIAHLVPDHLSDSARLVPLLHLAPLDIDHLGYPAIESAGDWP